MTQANDDALSSLQPMLRQLRDIKGLREVRPGSFHLRGSAFVQIQGEGAAPVAELRKPGGSGFDRYPLDTPARQRKLVDDAKRRAVGDDD